LLEAIERAASVASSADLFAIALEDPLFLEQIEFAVADLLEAGKATVVDAWSMLDEETRIVSKVRLFARRSEGFEGRAYCTPKDDLLLDLSYVYYD